MPPTTALPSTHPPCACSYLRGRRGARIKKFSEQSLFAGDVDSQWVEQCIAGARQTRTRHATYSYLCGTLPGGVWRDDRTALLRSLDVPVQIIRGDAIDAVLGQGASAERVVAQAGLLSLPSCCALVKGARSVLPYEAPRATAELLAAYIARHFDDGAGELAAGLRGRRWSGLYEVLVE